MAKSRRIQTTVYQVLSFFKCCYLVHPAFSIARGSPVLVAIRRLLECWSVMYSCVDIAAQQNLLIVCNKKVCARSGDANRRRLLNSLTLTLTMTLTLDLLNPKSVGFDSRCASGCVVACRICNREVEGSNLSLGYFAPRCTQPSIPPGHGHPQAWARGGAFALP